MSRFLFVVPPLTGHINPTVAVGEELVKGGHEVAWTGDPAVLAELLPAGAAVLAADREGPFSDDWLSARGAANLQFLWEEFIAPLGNAMLPGVEAACDSFDPDVIVADQQAIAGALVARRRRLHWVTSATTSAELSGPLDAFPKVETWIRQIIDDFQIAHGLSDPVDLRFSPELVLAFTSQELLGREFPDHYAFVGTSLTERNGGGSFPWDLLSESMPKVLVSLGTLNGPAGKRFFDTVVDVARQLEGSLQMVCVAPEGMVEDHPSTMLVQPRLPQLQLLPFMDAVVCHGGHNTVCEALAHGLPLVLAPIRLDQPLVAAQVEGAGAGVRISFARIRPTDLRAAVTRVLDDPRFSEAARRIRASFARAGGAATAARRLEEIVLQTAGQRGRE